MVSWRHRVPLLFRSCLDKRQPHRHHQNLLQLSAMEDAKLLTISQRKLLRMRGPRRLRKHEEALISAASATEVPDVPTVI